MILTKVLIEASVVGFILVLIGTCVSYLISLQFSIKLPSVCKNWNKNMVMEIALFLTGFFTHILFEISGANQWYCKNGAACVK